MDVYFLRHGIAEDTARTDAERRLTAEGRDKCRQAAAGLAAVAPSLTHIWTSPLVRARETAALVCPGREAEVHEVLDNHGAAALIAELGELPGHSAVLLVGHEPQMSETIEALLGVAGNSGYVEMKKAGLAHLRVLPGHSAALVCLLTPRQLRALGSES